MHFFTLIAPGLFSFQPIFYGVVVICLCIIIIVFKQEIKAKKTAETFKSRCDQLQLELVKHSQHTHNIHNLMSMELDALNNSFSTFNHANRKELKKWELEQVAIECSTYLNIYQRVWNKL